MAEVIDYWPETRQKGEKRFRYPWAQWEALDENGQGDIWLAELGIDFPEDQHVLNFRNNLYTRAKSVTRIRKKKAPLVLKAVDGKVRRVPDYEVLHVKVKIVSDTQVAFQFYEGDMPEAPEVGKVAVPTRMPNQRRKPIHRRVTTSTIQKVPANAMIIKKTGVTQILLANGDGWLDIDPGTLVIDTTNKWPGSMFPTFQCYVTADQKRPWIMDRVLIEGPTSSLVATLTPDIPVDEADGVRR